MSWHTDARRTELARFVFDWLRSGRLVTRTRALKGGRCVAAVKLSARNVSPLAVCVRVASPRGRAARVLRMAREIPSRLSSPTGICEFWPSQPNVAPGVTAGL